MAGRRRFLLAVVIINTLAVVWNGLLLAAGVAWWPTLLTVLTLLNAACALISAYAWGQGKSSLL